MSDVLIGVGSNENARIRLFDAVQRLTVQSDQCSLSHLYLNNAASFPVDSTVKPVDSTPKYVNGVIFLSTSLELSALTSLLKQIELLAGGQRSGGICPLDLDIVAFEGINFDIQQRPLPRPLKSEEAYLWYCIQDLCNRIELNLPIPTLWLRQAWPEFSQWQTFHQHTSDRVVRLLDREKL
jgi:2-amino-4-hydroxy-6-hydroxymethyldihydropteridine diphosphokinase